MCSSALQAILCHTKIITTAEPNAAKTHALRDTVAKTVIETTLPTTMMNPLQKHEVRLIKSHQTAEILLCMKPQTPVNIFLLTDLLWTHLNQNVDTKLSVGFSQCFWVGFHGNQSSGMAKNIPSAQQQPLIKKTSWTKLNKVAYQASSHLPVRISNPFPLACLRNEQPKLAYYLPPGLPQGFPDSLNANIPIGPFTFQYIRIDGAISLARLFYDKNWHSVCFLHYSCPPS